MKRIIKMDEQVLMEPGNKEFAIWCTVNDCFHKIFDSYSWESADELDYDFQCAIRLADESERVRLEELRTRCVSLARGSGY